MLRSAWGRRRPCTDALPFHHCNRGVHNMTGSLEAIRYEHSASGRAELQVRPLCAWNAPQLHLTLQCSGMAAAQDPWSPCWHCRRRRQQAPPDQCRPPLSPGPPLAQLLEQRKLPLETEWLTIDGPQAAWTAIRDMTVRGAPAIGQLWGAAKRSSVA